MVKITIENVYLESIVLSIYTSGLQCRVIRIAMNLSVRDTWAVQPPRPVDTEFDCLFAILLSFEDSTNHGSHKAQSRVPQERKDGATDESSARHLEDIDSWLNVACTQHILSTNASGLDPDQLSEEVRQICISTPSVDMLQMKLFDLIGETGLDFICEILAKAAELRKPFKRRPKKIIEAKGDLTAPAKSSSFLVMTDSEKHGSSQSRKKQQREKERKAKLGDTADIDWLAEAGFEESYLEQERLLGLQGGALQSTATYVNDNSWMEGIEREYHTSVGLPAGTTRKYTPGTEEVFIPAPPKPPAVNADKLVAVSSLDSWAQLAFEGTDRLNRIQSAVFNTAYNSAENMLVCAPTGTAINTRS